MKSVESGFEHDMVRVLTNMSPECVTCPVNVGVLEIFGEMTVFSPFGSSSVAMTTISRHTTRL